MIITKILAYLLVTLTPSLVSSEQKGFVNGKNIKDNIFLTYKVINILNQKAYGGNVALKIDIPEAFDTLSWPFLLKTLSAFGFNTKFFNWVKIILQSTCLSIGMNVKKIDFFNYSNGVRHIGSPSLLIFIYVDGIMIFFRGD